MLKQPTTKKLSEKKVSHAVDYNKNPYEKMFDDEKFYQFPQYPNVFVSQYETIISLSGDTPHQKKPSKDKNSDYYFVMLYKNGEGKKHYVHRMVAEVWCEKPTFEMPYKLQVHHNKKVIKYGQSIDVNFAENLQWVYAPYHAMLDSIKSMQVKTPTGNYKYLKEVREIADYYNVSEQFIFELLKKQPYETDGTTEIYKSDNIEIKVRRYKP